MTALPREEGLVRAQRRMRRALEIARAETPAGDVPIAAVIYDADGVELAWGTNRREADGDPTAHAEVVAMRSAVGRHGDGWRLSGCELVVTVEPCIMCAGAIINARVDSVVYGAVEPKTGAAGSLVDVLREPPGLHHPQVRGGVLAEQATGLMLDFFAGLRGQGPGGVASSQGPGQGSQGGTMNFIDKAKGMAGDAINRARDAAANIDKDKINEQVDKLQEKIGNEKINDQIDNLQERFGTDGTTGTADGPLDTETDPEAPKA